MSRFSAPTLGSRHLDRPTAAEPRDSPLLHMIIILSASPASTRPTLGTHAERPSGRLWSGRDDCKVGVWLVGVPDEGGEDGCVTVDGDPVGAAGHEEGDELLVGRRERDIGGRKRVGWVVDEDAVAQLHAVVLVVVGDVPGDREVCVPCGGPVDANGDGVKELGDGQRRSEASSYQLNGNELEHWPERGSPVQRGIRITRLLPRSQLSGCSC